ncbi:MAG: dihydrodipicolinate synthase family protein [Oscillospiraceae bacterium]|jgi:dihydrodipicolinate synthase/N-acetylneuraminate lyase
MLEKTFYGIIPPALTPFTRDGELDMALFEKDIRLLLDAGVHGISIGGSTGEGAFLDDNELHQLIAHVRKMDSDIPILAGIIRNSARSAISAGKAAKAAGANGLMITPTSYTPLVPDEDGNYAYFNEISNAIDLPIVIYNVVKQNVISAPLFKRMAEGIENVQGIKQSCGSIPALYDMLMTCGKSATIYSATDEMLCTTYELGAAGAISAVLTVFPEICVEMWNEVKAGNVEKARSLQDRIYFVWQAIAGNQFPIRAKYALKLLGRDLGYTRNPITSISDAEKERIRSALQQNGFI